MEIYLVRHGKTAWNRVKKLQGSTDIELAEEGIRMAESSGIGLRNVSFDRVYSSPLKRARRTAELFLGGRDIPIIEDSRLRELNYGIYEGMTADELALDPDCTFKYFFSDPELYVPGSGGESFSEAIERASDFMESEIEPLKDYNERILIVAHGAINRAIMMHVRGENDISKYWQGDLQQNCGVIILELDEKGYSVKDEDAIFYK